MRFIDVLAFNFPIKYFEFIDLILFYYLLGSKSYLSLLFCRPSLYSASPSSPKCFTKLLCHVCNCSVITARTDRYVRGKDVTRDVLQTGDKK